MGEDGLNRVQFELQGPGPSVHPWKSQVYSLLLHPPDLRPPRCWGKRNYLLYLATSPTARGRRAVFAVTSTTRHGWRLGSGCGLTVVVLLRAVGALHPCGSLQTVGRQVAQYLS